jgi:hypothetical protein
MKHTTRWMKVVSILLLTVLGISAFGSATVANAQGDNTPAAQRLVRQLSLVLLEETHKATGLTNADILKELRGGKTLAEVITGHGATVEAVKSAAKTQATDKLKQAVTDGKITQKQADLVLARLDGAIDTLLNTKWPGTAAQDRQTQMLQAAGVRLLISETAKQSDISQRDLMNELRAGKTLAQVATEHHADPVKIVNAAVATATDRINKLVENDKLRREQADTLIAALPEGLTKLMNQPYPLRRQAGPNRQATPEATAPAG